MLFLDSVINTDVAKYTIETLLYYDTDEKHAPISMYINSPGGSVPDGFAIIDTMELIKSPINTYVVGRAYSMAAMIAIAGNDRKATKRSIFMFHEPSYGHDFEKISRIKDSEKYLHRVEELMKELLESKTKLKYNQLTFGADLYFYGEELIEKGIVSEIISQE